MGYTGGVRPRPPDPEYLKLLLPYGEMIQKLALAARKLILEEAPAASEFVYEVYTIADHFTFTERPSDAAGGQFQPPPRCQDAGPTGGCDAGTRPTPA